MATRKLRHNWTFSWTTTDGSANTILAIVAGADKAEIWTKPGGLNVDFNAPKKSLGAIKSEFLQLLFFDGSVVTNLPTSIDDKRLALMIQPRDGTPINFEGARQLGSVPAVPTMIFTLANDARREEIVKTILADSVEETIGGKSLQKNSTAAVWAADNRTIITGTVESINRLMTSANLNGATSSTLLEQLKLNADLTFAFDVEAEETLVKQFTKLNPTATEMLGQLKTLSAGISATAHEGDPLVEVVATVRDSEKAAIVSDTATVGLSKAQEIIRLQPLPPNANFSDEEIKSILKQLATATTVTNLGSQITLRIPATSSYGRVPELLAPTIIHERAKSETARQKKKLQRIGLAFRRFHEVHNHGPGAGRIAAGKPVGLSWRVYLLPYLGLEEAELYNRFHLDELWDSEHNKSLIAKMPDSFKCLGTDVGKTPLHVFTGPGAPFADDKTPAGKDITDAFANTILVVIAGTDTAEIWTKPGGLNFDPKDPIKALGNMQNDEFVTVMGDGNVREFRLTISARELTRFIQHEYSDSSR